GGLLLPQRRSGPGDPRVARGALRPGRREPLRARGAVLGAAGHRAHARSGGRGSLRGRPRGGARDPAAGRCRRRNRGRGCIHGLSRRLPPRRARLGGGPPPSLRRRRARRLASRRPAVPSDRGRGERDPRGMTTPILLDCDPGHDDAIALLLALASPEVELLGVTTVAGNQTVEKTTANAIRVLELAGREDLPVAAGAGRPLVREPYVAAYVHGESGLDGSDLPPPQADPVAQHAVDFLAERVAGATLVATGPLTD